MTLKKIGIFLACVFMSAFALFSMEGANASAQPQDPERPTEANLSKLTLNGPVIPKVGEISNYRLAITNDGDERLRNLKVRFVGTGAISDIDFVTRIGDVPPHRSRLLSHGLIFGHLGEGHLSVRVTSANGGRKAVSQAVQVKQFASGSRNRTRVIPNKGPFKDVNGVRSRLGDCSKAKRGGIVCVSKATTSRKSVFVLKSAGRARLKPRGSVVPVLKPNENGLPVMHPGDRWFVRGIECLMTPNQLNCANHVTSKKNAHGAALFRKGINTW